MEWPADESGAQPGEGEEPLSVLVAFQEMQEKAHPSPPPPPPRASSVSLLRATSQTPSENCFSKSSWGDSGETSYLRGEPVTSQGNRPSRTRQARSWQLSSLPWPCHPSLSLARFVGRVVVRVKYCVSPWEGGRDGELQGYWVPNALHGLYTSWMAHRSKAVWPWSFPKQAQRCSWPG